MSAEDNRELINKFYTAFTEKNGDAMAACYHEDVTFEDPAFGVLKGEHAGNMWKMLTKRAPDLEITFSNVEANEETGSAKWEAKYSFRGNPVHNKVDASFKFKDGKIIDHHDVFNLYKWSQQAFGIIGFLIGWSRTFKLQFNKQSKKMLEKFEERLLQKNAKHG